MCMKQEWVERLGISQTSTWILQERIAMSESLRQSRWSYFYFIDNEFYFSGFAPYDGDPKLEY